MFSRKLNLQILSQLSFVATRQIEEPIIDRKATVTMADAMIILETHIYSNTPNGLPPWVRSFHLRLSATGKKADILKLVRDSMVRLGRPDPVAEEQITLYWTRHGRVVSIPGTNSSTAAITLPIYQPSQLFSFNVGYPMVYPQHPQTAMVSGYPLALTYSGGANYLHSYGPNPVTMPPTMVPAQQTWMVGHVNVPFFAADRVGGIGGQPIVSDVVREARLDTLAEEGLDGMLEWATGPTGLKLILIVDVDGRGVISGHIGSPAAPVAPGSPSPASSAPAASHNPGD
ncbi:uncharacterized protein LY79DRAFT_349167 [Colletotrichum navitas]|uniref:Uncharacterized protein n=1 Tax=Colletotrichum navitas TaxID=681940 RepID=A0AAD8Q9Q7_9PEZI|nr:uncharacterized protein LY79DRAFT_349167 [Colletotrichum navitas]KAK1597582.1 hypothetical protein LY79DRAFT_349167 [Colletotrichum navitas]